MGAKIAYVVGLIMFILLTGLNIAVIVVGALYLHDCPAERYIPIYLIVSGAFGLVFSLCGIVNIVRTFFCGESQEELMDGNRGCAGCLGLLFCFLFAWFIAGNVWVYRTHGDWSPNKSAVNYCHPTLYYFAFWIVTGSYIMSVLGSCCGCGARCLN